MASAAFPAAFNYMTLRDFRDPRADPPRYLHVFDGGNADNLGLTSIRRILQRVHGRGRYDHYVVILVDAYISPPGVDRNQCNPREPMSYAVDKNFLDTFDSLLRANREKLIAEFQKGVLSPEDPARTMRLGNLVFWHITFQDIRHDVPDIDIPRPSGETVPSLRSALNRIGTRFRLDPDDARRIDRAVDLLVSPEREECRRIRELLVP